MAHKIGVHPIFLLSSAGLLTLGKLREKEAALYRHRPGAYDSFLALSFTFVSLFVLLNKEKQWDVYRLQCSLMIEKNWKHYFTYT